MGTNESKLRGGISAMFGEGTVPAPERKPISEEEYAELEHNQTERRKFLTGRRSKDDPRALVTSDDMRSSLILNKTQYAIVREIALRECVTIKELVYAMFQLAIDKYEAKNGKVIPRKVSTDVNNIFK